LIDTQVPVAVAFSGSVRTSGSTSESPPGPGDYGALAIARTLGRIGVPVYLVAQESTTSPVFYSRYWKDKREWDFFGGPEQGSVSFLREIGTELAQKHGSRGILLTPSDWFAIFIERHSEELADCFRFPRAESPIVERLLDKWDMQALAAEHGIPTPVTARPTSRAEIDEFVAKAGFPLVVKPADPYLPDHISKAIARSRAELEDAVREAISRESWNFILQEYIPGGVESVWMCNGYFGRGANHGVVFTGRKLRQQSSTGVASFAVCESNDTVASQTYRFMTAVGYRGCVGIGWRYDRRDGAYKILDVNARVSSVFRLFAGANDLDVVRLCYLDLSGQPMGDIAAQEGRKWLDERDIRVVLPSRGEDRVSVREWVKSLRGVRELHWLARDDLGPVGAWLRRRIVRKVDALAGGH
jgi:D-aspartate ligase